MNIFFTIILYINMAFLPSTQTMEGVVTIEVTNLRSNKGYVLISMFDSENDFPENAANAVSKARVSISGGVAAIEFKNLKEGDYAVAVMHDENDNKEMDFNVIGIPKEGYGFSNNAKGVFGPPTFKKASFRLNATKRKIIIKTTYAL